MSPSSRYRLAYHFGGNSRSLVSESRTYPGARPGVADIFSKRITRYPKGAPVCVFGVEHTTPPRWYKLWCAWLLPIVVSVGDLSGSLIETI